MHRVRFLSVAYMTLNRLFADFYVLHICGFTIEFIALCSLFGKLYTQNFIHHKNGSNVK